MTFFLPHALLQKRSNSDKASRVFVYIDQEISDQIKAINDSIKQQLSPKRWRWSVKVTVKIGRLDRETSLFPDKKSWCYLLPIKAEVRKKLAIKEGDLVWIHIDLMDYYKIL